MAASTFGSANIRVELGPDGSSPWWERPSFTATRHIPGSNDDVIQNMGYGHGVVTLRLLVDPTEWTALLALQLTTATLTVGGTSYGDALLEALAAPVREVDGWVTVQATFRKTASG